MRRELKLLLAKPAEIVWPAMFHVMIVSMFPLAIGAGPDILQRIAAGVFWMSAMLAILMAAGRLFDLDSEHGALMQVRVAGGSLATLCAGKFAASFIAICLPIALISYPLGLLYHLPLAMMNNLTLSLIFGLVSLVAFSGLFAALGLMARNAQVMMCLLAFPVFVPLLIFGTSAVNATGLHFSSPLVVLISLACLTMLTVPLVTAKVLALALE
jgi:heme exporter protein B